MYCSGSNPLTSQAKRTRWLEGSNLVIGAAPDFPASSPSQVDSTSFPTGVTRPRPVTTTLCGKLLSDLFVEVGHGIAHGTELLRFFVRDIDVELFFKSHNELHGIEAVRAEIFHEAGFVG